LPVGANEPGLRQAFAAIYRAARSGTFDANNQPDQGFDPKFCQAVEPLLEFLWARYFRVSLTGIENIPTTGPALLVANHSGGVPYDGTLLMYGLRRDHPAHRFVRALVASFPFRLKHMAPVVSRYGGVRASMENGEALLREGNLVAVFPEGLRGVGKLFRERYRLTRFGRGGFVRLARQTSAPIIPIAIVGAEEIHPVVGKLTTVARPFGLPFIPITPTFPILGPLGMLPLPTKWSIRIGPPIQVDGNLTSEAATLAQAEEVRKTVDSMIAEMLVQRRSIFWG